MTINLWQRYDPSVAGTLLVWPDFYSPQLDNRRNLLVYLPPSYDHSDRRYPVLYMHDGQNLFDRATSFAGNTWQVGETLDRLANEGVEAIVVGVNNAGEQRTAEYNPFPNFWQGHGEVYLQFLSETVKPLIDQDFRTRPDRDSTGIMGSSMGGLISLYAYFRATATFGFAGVMSPSLWVGGGAMYGVVESSSFIPGKLYVDNGTREPSARRLNAMLLKKGYRRDVDLKYVAEPDGEHNEIAWARRLPDALRFLIPR